MPTPDPLDGALPPDVEELLGGRAALIERLPVVTYVADLDGPRLRYVSPQAEDLLGFPAHDYVADPALFAARLHPDDRDAVLPVMFARTGNGIGHFRMVARDGRTVWLAHTRVEVTNAASHLMVGTLLDITESRQVARRLEETERRFRDIAENVRAVFWIRDVESGQIHYVSPGYEEIWGRPADALYNDAGSWIDAIHPHDRAHVKEAAFGGDPRSYEAEYRIVTAAGEVRWIHDRAFCLRESQERSAVVTGMAEDVTERRRTEADLRAERERARAAFLNAPIGSALFTFSDEPRLLEVNPAFCSLLGYPEEELRAMSIQQLIHPGDEVDFTNWDRLVSGAIDSYGAERRLLRADGRTVWVRMSLSLVRDGRGEPAYGVTQVEDITAARRSAAQQDAVARLGKMALEGAPVEDLMTEAVVAVNEMLETKIAGVLEYEPGKGFRHRASTGVPAGLDPVAGAPTTSSGHLVKTLEDRRPVVIEDWSDEERFERNPFIEKLGAQSTVSVPIEGPQGTWGVLAAHACEPRRFPPDSVSFAHAIANVLGAAIQRSLSEEDTRHRALHDPLTGLPNRTLFLDRLEHALGRRDRGGVAVLFMDLDHFKVINDSLGHEAGDQLLCAFAPRLQEALRPSDTVARFGGDEFVVLCDDLDGEQDAVKLAERILAGLGAPLTVGTHELFTSATIGLAVARRGDTPEGLIRDADAAMYRAKARGRGRYELFDQAMRERVSERLRIENSLRRALADGGLELHFQPIVSLSDHTIVGAEALLRWNDPERGWIPPSDFIPIAEESGLIVPMGDWVVEEAARLARDWPPPRPGLPQPHVAVNLSARQVANPGFADRLAEAIERSGLPPARLSLEITETVLMEEAEAPMEAVRDLKRLGVRLVLDDFGTGYSSLSYLNRLPIDVLKLDRSFIAPLREDGNATAAIVYGVVTMAEALGMTVVAEGVEEHAHVDKLRALGCDFAQGYLFARPMPVGELRELLAAGALPTPPASASPSSPAR